MTKPLYLPDLADLDSWIKDSAVGEKEVQSDERALVLFEIVDQEPGWDSLIRKVAEALDGDIIAETEHGLLGRFKDPLNAALAALNLKRATRVMNLKIRTGLTWGVVPTGKEKAARHLRNGTARRCLRIFSVALPHQVLIDDDFLGALGTRLSEYPEILVSEDLMEMTTSDTGYAAPTEHHVPILGDVELSPVQAMSFPPDTEPERYLTCMTCRKALQDDGSDGMLVIERKDEVIEGFHLFHKGDCDTLKTQSWRDLADFANPEFYIQFVVALLNNWSMKGLQVKNDEGLVRLIMGMYRKVFRPTTSAEHLNFIGIMRLIQLMGE